MILTIAQLPIVLGFVLLEKHCMGYFVPTPIDRIEVTYIKLGHESLLKKT